jgi:hypothetical protein
MKQVIAAVLTFALMGVLLSSGLRRSRAPATAPVSEPDTPAISAERQNPAQAAVLNLLESASRGDVPSYLDAFTGPLRTRLEHEVTERGRESFAEDLRRAARSRKSHAVFTAEVEGSESARVTVESVYPDRNERQTYRLVPEQSAWRVAEVESVRSHQPKAKFGSPAVYIAPEGVPVQGGVTVETGDDAERPVSPLTESDVDKNN